LYEKGEGDLGGMVADKNREICLKKLTVFAKKIINNILLILEVLIILTD